MGFFLAAFDRISWFAYVYLEKKVFFYHSSFWEDIRSLHFNKLTRGLLQVGFNGGLVEYSKLHTS